MTNLEKIRSAEPKVAKLQQPEFVERHGPRNLHSCRGHEGAGAETGTRRRPDACRQHRAVDRVTQTGIPTLRHGPGLEPATPTHARRVHG